LPLQQSLPSPACDGCPSGTQLGSGAQAHVPLLQEGDPPPGQAAGSWLGSQPMGSGAHDQVPSSLQEGDPPPGQAAGSWLGSHPLLGAGTRTHWAAPLDWSHSKPASHVSVRQVGWYVGSALHAHWPRVQCGTPPPGQATGSWLGSQKLGSGAHSHLPSEHDASPPPGHATGRWLDLHAFD
jgi:hypothetical protein